MNLIFDVAHTLVDRDLLGSREFLGFVQSGAHAVWLITDMDYTAAVAAAGVEVCEAVAGVYACGGNQLYTGGVLQEQQTWEPEPELLDFLQLHLSLQPWPIKSGQHLERRTGMIIWRPEGGLGSAASVSQFQAWDQVSQYRANLAQRIESAFPALQATVSQGLGVIIHPRGFSSVSIADRIRPFDFFGGGTEPRGNNAAIAQRAERVWEVASWRQARGLLISHYGLEVHARDQ